MDIPLPQLVAENGVLVALLVWFVFRELWPWIRDRLLPGVAEARKAEKQAERELLKQLEAEAQQREDRAWAVLANVTTALTELRVTLSGMNIQLAQQADSLTTVQQDVARLYTFLDAHQPSRVVKLTQTEVTASRAKE